MALLFVLGFLAAFFTTVFYLHSFSTNQRYQSHLISSSEVASRVAEFGAKQVYSMVHNAVEFLNSTDPDTFPKREKGLKEAQVGMKEFFEVFVDESGRLSSKEQSALISIPLAADTVLTGLTSTPNLKVTLTLEGQKSIHEAGAIPGDSDQSAETIGKFIIDSTAEYNNVERRVLSVFEQRTIQMTIPVLSRFALTVLETPDKGKLNPNVCSARGSNPETFTDATFTPLVILGGQPVSNSKSFDPALFLDKQGWVFILPEIRLGMAPGNGKYGENFLLAGESTFFREIQQGSGPFGKSFGVVRQKTFELWNTHQIYSRLTGVYGETQEEECYYFLKNVPPTENVRYSSILRLMGTQENPSPTLVFGNVLRSYILEQGLQKKSGVSPTDCALLPYVPKGKFNDVSWTASLEVDSLTVLKETCNNSWDEYRQAMSVPVSNVPYNEGLAFCFDAQGYAGKTSPRTMQPSFATKVIPKLGKCLSYVENQPEDLLLDANTALYREENQIFSGDLAKVLPYIGNYCIARCSRQFETSKALKEHLTDLRSSGTNPTGFYFVKGSFEWTEDWNDLAVGGIGLVCEKGIKITGMVKPSPPSALVKEYVNNQIYFVSLAGDIAIQTSKRIEAALVAVNGKVCLSGAGMDIFGFVAAKVMEFSSLCDSSTKVIRYDLRYDWSDSQAYRQGFRTSLERQPIVFFAKPN